MVLVDTSVWVDFFQRPASTHAVRLAGLIREHNQAVICGIILQEVLQGIRDAKSHALTRDLMLRLPYLEASRDTHVAAATLYRTLRAKGITVPSVDVTIAALAIDKRLPLYTKDAHFTVIADQSRLLLHS